MKKKQKPLVGNIEIVYVETSKLKPAPYNPRIIEAGAFKRLKRSLSHFGIVDPLVARKSDMTVIGGHQRLAALLEMGIKKTPVVLIDIDDEQAKALNVQLNNPNSQGTWDDETLAELLRELGSGIEDIEITGFTQSQIEELTALPDFDPATIDDQQRLDRKKPVTCPECGFEFTP